MQGICSYRFNTPDIEQAYTLRHAIDLHVHESCMRVAVRVLHSCAFIIIIYVVHPYNPCIICILFQSAIPTPPFNFINPHRNTRPVPLFRLLVSVFIIESGVNSGYGIGDLCVCV